MRYNRRILEAFMRVARLLTIVCATVVTVSLTAAQQPPPPAAAAPAPAPNPRLDQYKRDVGLEVDGMQENIQKMNDMVFSFAEPGFQEFETSKYLTDLLEKNGFKIERSYAGVPTAWFTTWGSGKPVIAIGRCRSSTRSRARAPTLPRNRGAAARRSTPSS